MYQQQQPMMYQQQQPMMYQQQQPMMYQQPGMIVQQPGMIIQQPGMMVQQPGMMMMMQPGYQLLQVKKGSEKLHEQSGVFIHQKFLFLEALTGCEMENKFTISRLSKDGQNKLGRPFLKARERSGFCSRQCLHPACRPFEMFIENDDSQAPQIDETPFLRINRPFVCACLCLDRPYAEIYLTEDGADNRLGTAKAPYTFFDHQIDIHGPNDEIKYKIIGNCCQLGFWCKWPCDPCQQIHFDIQDGGGNVVGNLEKFSQGCIKASIDDVSNFAVEFPQNISFQDKALFVAATLFLDMRFFLEQPSGDQNNNNGW